MSDQLVKECAFVKERARELYYVKKNEIAVESLWLGE